ncbi:MAG: hypothetical protein WC087_01050 [Candidatus Paceibacterota bacterium]
MNFSKSQESPPPINSNERIIQEMKEEISGRLDRAINNPISEERFSELELQLQNLKENFLKKGYRESPEIDDEDSIEKEIFASSAIADTIVEFKEMLDQLGDRFGKYRDWVGKYLAHENAHTNVAETLGYEKVGYATVFIKDENENLAFIQPLHFSKPQIDWGPRESLEKQLEVASAPEKYGDKLSDSDEANIEEYKKDLEELNQSDLDKEKELSEIRSRLNSNQ